MTLTPKRAAELEKRIHDATDADFAPSLKHYDMEKDNLPESEYSQKAIAGVTIMMAGVEMIEEKLGPEHVIASLLGAILTWAKRRDIDLETGTAHTTLAKRMLQASLSKFDELGTYGETKQ